VKCPSSQTHGRERATLIYVSPDQLKQVEYLIHQSIQGNHLLFDPDRVKEIFFRAPYSEFTEADAYEVEHHIERLLLRPTLQAKRAYLDELDAATYERVVRTYFNIVENNLFESRRVLH
jgi:hypothetical protein